MSAPVKALYLKENPNRHDMGWRDSLRFDKDEIGEIIAHDNKIKIEFGKSKPCGRGCCSDWITDSMTIPDNLITLYEVTQVGVYSDEFFEDEEARVAYNKAIGEHVELIVADLEVRMTAAKLQEEKATNVAREAAARAKEESDRAEFERLKAKYEGAGNVD